jgi:hypothetical protein
MVGDLLRDFEFAAVLQIRRNAGRAEGMIANPRFDAGRFRAPADDAVGVLLEEGIGCKLESISNRGLRGLLLNLRLLVSLHSLIPTNEGLPELVIEYLRPDLE